MCYSLFQIRDFPPQSLYTFFQWKPTKEYTQYIYKNHFDTFPNRRCLPIFLLMLIPLRNQFINIIQLILPIP